MTLFPRPVCSDDCHEIADAFGRSITKPECGSTNSLENAKLDAPIAMTVFAKCLVYLRWRGKSTCCLPNSQQCFGFMPGRLTWLISQRGDRLKSQLSAA